MQFDDFDDLKMATEAAVERWEDFSRTLGIDDPLLPQSAGARRWALENDFRLFAEFWSPENADSPGDPRLIAKLIGDWLVDRVSRNADRIPEERRASIILGEPYFFGPDKVEGLLRMPFDEEDLRNLQNIPNEADLRKSRGDHLLYYGRPMTDRQVLILIWKNLMAPEVQRCLKSGKREYLRESKKAFRVIEPRWYLVPIEQDEEAEASWPEAFGYVLLNLFRESPFAKTA